MSGNGGSAVGLLSYETLVHAVAGAMGSVTAMTIFFPLDTAKSRLQDLRKLLQSHRKHQTAVEAEECSS